MPDPQRPAGGQAQPRGLGGTLKSKMGPLPLWGWLAIMTVIAVAYYLYAKNKSAQQAPTPTAGAPGVTVINQGDLPPTSPPPEPPKPKGKDDDDKSKGSGDKKDDAEEAQDDKSGSGDHHGGRGGKHHGGHHHGR